MKRSRGRPCKPIDPLRWAAKQAGEKQYMPAGPCQRGHVAKRFTSNNWCVACLHESRGKKFTGQRIVDEKTSEREEWLAHRKAARAKYRRSYLNHQEIGSHAR